MQRTCTASWGCVRPLPTQFACSHAFGDRYRHARRRRPQVACLDGGHLECWCVPLHPTAMTELRGTRKRGRHSMLPNSALINRLKAKAKGDTPYPLLPCKPVDSPTHPPQSTAARLKSCVRWGDGSNPAGATVQQPSPRTRCDTFRCVHLWRWPVR